MKKELKWAVLGTGVIANEMAAGLQKMGKSLYAVGNRTYDKAVAFAEKALKRFPNTAAEEFFCGIGINFVYDEVGRAYPYSLQASSVVDMLRFAADEAGVACDEYSDL